MSNWPDECSKMKIERDEWREMARRFSTVITTKQDLEAAENDFMQGRIGVTDPRLTETERSYLKAIKAISRADLARAAAPDDGDGGEL